MRDTRVEEVEPISDSDSDENGDSAATSVGVRTSSASSKSEPTVGIFPNHVQQDPTYLIFSSKSEKEKWLYELTVVSGGNPKAGTQFEQLVQKLMEEDGNPVSSIWRHPLMVCSVKETLSAPLTTFTSEALREEALKLFKSLQLFTSVVLDSAGIDYHVMLAANALQQCLDVPELQPELLCALVKLTSKLRTATATTATTATSGQGSGSGSATGEALGGGGGTQVKKHSSIKHPKSFLMNATQLFSGDSDQQQQQPLAFEDSKANPSNCVFIQGWMLMSMAVSVFLPKDSRLLWFLRTHFARNKDTKTETGKYSAYCGRALERTVANGPRQAKPSRMEVLSILLKNPHHHSLPHALPVHFLNDTYHVVGFDGSTTIREFVAQLDKEALGGGGGDGGGGFAIFSDDPIDKDLDHALHFDDKVCDVISRWETALREKGMGKFENKRVIRFVYKSRLYWRSSQLGHESDKERLLLCYQVSQQIVRGQFPLTKELAFELAALMAQIHFGDLHSSSRAAATTATAAASSAPQLHLAASEALGKFFPVRYLDALTRDEQLRYEKCLLDKWTTLKAKSAVDCVRIFLTCARKWQFFGAKLFEVEHSADGCSLPSVVWLTVGEDGLCVLDHATMQLQSRYAYQSIVTFGGCQDDFMLVVAAEAAGGTVSAAGAAAEDDEQGTVRLLFHTKKPEILEITLLIADYMNMIDGHNHSGTSSGGGVGGGGGLLTAPATPKMTTLSRGHSTRASSRGGSMAPANLTFSTAPNTPRMNHRSTDCLIQAPTVTSSSETKVAKKRHQLDSGVA